MEKMQETTIVGMRLRKDMGFQRNRPIHSCYYLAKCFGSLPDPGSQGTMIWSKISGLQIDDVDRGSQARTSAN